MKHAPATPDPAASSRPQPEEGEFLEALTVTDLTVDGKAVARHEGRVVFLDKGLPGEVVSARVTETAKRLIHARVERSLQPSPHAVEPWCPHVTECGACAWQHFSDQAAREWKRKHVRETLARIGKVDSPEVFPLIPSPGYREYRNKMAFAFGPGQSPEGAERVLLGLRKFREKAVVEVTRCGMQPPEAMRVLAHARRTVNSLGLKAWQAGGAGYLRFLVVHAPDYEPDGKPQVLLECITGSGHRQAVLPGDGTTRGVQSNADAVRELGRSLMEEFSLTGFVHSERKNPADVAQGERIVSLTGSASYQERFGHLVLTVPHNAFLQTNSALAGLLYECALAEAGLTGRETVWDLYCGAGAVALYVAGQAREVHGFDIQADAIAAARKNSAALGFAHCRFHKAAVSSSLLSSTAVPDVIFADPPRAGIDRSAIDLLLAVPARRLIYMSCDPGTQARDIALLSPVWKVRRSRPADMFPHTPHVENVVVLDRISK